MKNGSCALRAILKRLRRTNPTNQTDRLTWRGFFYAAGVYLPEGRHPIIPLFHHSIIPVVSEANPSSFIPVVFWCDYRDNQAGFYF